MKYKGSCHCGNIAFEVDGELSEVVTCNCSICQRKGALHWAVSRDKLHLLTKPEAIEYLHVQQARDQPPLLLQVRHSHLRGGAAEPRRPGNGHDQRALPRGRRAGIAAGQAIQRACALSRDKPMDQAFAERFAVEWIEAWNAHDLERVMSHYAEDFEMSSPYIVQIAGESSGTLRGKAAVRAYWKKALELVPDLKFELVTAFVGAHSIALYYKGARRRIVVEVVHFGPNGKVVRAFAHYAD